MDTVAQSAWEALVAIHLSGSLHGDLHENNVMVVNGHVRFIDFGFARSNTSTAECGRKVKVLEGIMHLHSFEAGHLRENLSLCWL